MQTMKIERLSPTHDSCGLKLAPNQPVIRFTLTHGESVMAFDMPEFLSEELVKLATDPDAKPFFLQNFPT